MKYYFLSLVFSACTLFSLAQKKIVPVSQSTVTAMLLPEGAKQDGRGLMILSAKALLQMEAKKGGVSVNRVEILYLPGTFTADAFMQAAIAAGWAASPSAGDKDYYWLQKDGRNVVAYFSNKKNQTDLYFGEAGNAGNNTVQQPTNNDNTNVQNTQQQPDVQQPVVQQQENNNNNNTNTNTNNNTINTSNTAPVNTPAVSDGFAFNTTNFDDGWTSVIKEDWVEVTRGSIKVLLHYPKEGTIFPADPEPLTNAAWNILVAPRYSNLSNYKTSYISNYIRTTVGMGTATENATGNTVFVLLFRRGEGWIEFVAPDKNTLVQQFNCDPETIRYDSDDALVNALANMKGYNRFAVAATDIAGTGKWSDHFASNTYYTNIYTGNSAGMSTYSSSQWFEFSGTNAYKWQLVAANSYGGSTSFASAKGEGTFEMAGNWQMSFSDIEGKPKTYDVYFTANKGGRVLWMNDANYKGSGIFTGYIKE